MTRKWADILTKCGVKPATAARWATVFEAEIKPGTFSAGDAELDDFLGQVLHESAMLERLEENLNYSVDGLLKTFGRHRISESDARRYGRIDGRQPANRQAIANTIYGGPWGRKNLGNVDANDGWTCRGSGLIQVTGLANLIALAKIVGWKGNPRDLGLALRSDPATALRVSILWWEGNVPDAIMGNIKRVTARVNGGTLGLDHRAEVTEKARRGLA
jgi:putative chitinase